MSNQESKTPAMPAASPKAATSAPEPAKAAPHPTPAVEAQPSLRAEPQTMTFTDNDRNVVIQTQPSKEPKEEAASNVAHQEVRRAFHRNQRMKFALVNGQRQEAQPNLSGKCPTCDHPVVAKCGEVRIWHWAHQGSRSCDPWWENETEWHRAWKGQFPANWQEVVHQAETGEKHRADVKTDRGWVIEFQYSYLTPEERRSRDAFYPKLIWVVNGTRRKRDSAQLLNAWKEGVPVGANSLVRRAFSDNCALLREWAGSDAPIFFDLGEPQVLWWLFAKSTDGPAYVAPYSRARFIEAHRGGATEIAREFDEFVKDIPKLVGDYESHFRAQASRRFPPDPLQSFQQYLARRNRPRRRL